MNISFTCISKSALCQRVLALTLVCIPLFGCATNTSTQTTSTSPISTLDQNSPEALIATDLISVIMQLPDFIPWATTFTLSPPSSLFGKNIESALRLSGYGVQLVSADQGDKYISYTRSQIFSNEGQSTKYSITVGRLSISRNYEFDEGQVSPASLITLKGVKPQKITLNDDLYRQRGGDRIVSNGVSFQTLDGRILEANLNKLRITEKSKIKPGELFSYQRFLRLSRSRLYLDSKLSSSKDVRQWNPVRQVLLVFPTQDNDYLGSKNKTVIQKMLKFHDPQTTGFGITGCKGHSSLLWDGTEGESLDRQLRVRNELLASGVDIDLVRENGCFATEFDSLLKKNSVLLTLHQRR